MAYEPYVKAVKKIYNKDNWENLPSKETPVIAESLDILEEGISNNSINIGDILTTINNMQTQISSLDTRVKKLESDGGGGDVEIVSWADGTDAQIAAMAEALRNGTISVEDTDWEVGQERTVHLSAIESDNFGNHAEQTQTLVILHKGGKLLENGEECSFIVGLKNCLANGNSVEGFDMNASITNTGGWEESRMRTGCNEDFVKMLPEDLRPTFVRFKNITGVGTEDANITSIDLFALPAEKEVFGTNSHASSTAEAELFRFEYYSTQTSRVKKAGDSGSSCSWWERSPRSSGSTEFCYVYVNGLASYSNSSFKYGLAPFGCI